MQGHRSAVLLFLAISCSHLEIGTTAKVCQQPPKRGQCEGDFNRYFYNSTGHQCQHFLYGGCGGNDNRFHSMEKCQIACVQREVCSQTEKPGSCRARMHRYYFNSSTSSCERFTYGGCGGNGNRFITKKACQSVCLSKEALCVQPPEKGRCSFYIPSYYYNSTTTACEQFVYSGCGGNGNRFNTMAECGRACAQTADTPLTV
ncbi:hypothetical protein ACOMHN_053784 [Nucella lapillus]